MAAHASMSGDAFSIVDAAFDFSPALSLSFLPRRLKPPPSSPPPFAQHSALVCPFLWQLSQSTSRLSRGFLLPFFWVSTLNASSWDLVFLRVRLSSSSVANLTTVIEDTAIPLNSEDAAIDPSKP